MIDSNHMASVAREFGIPAIVDEGNAISASSRGEIITMRADTATIYSGIVGYLVKEMKTAKKLIFDSPVNRRMRSIPDRISSLPLTYPRSPSFAPKGCTNYHAYP